MTHLGRIMRCPIISFGYIAGYALTKQTLTTCRLNLYNGVRIAMIDFSGELNMHECTESLFCLFHQFPCICTLHPTSA